MKVASTGSVLRGTRDEWEAATCESFINNKLMEEEKDRKRDKKSKDKKSKREAKDHQTDDAGNPFFDLSAKRRATVSKYKGIPLIDIREFYIDKEGKTLMGKKGIALTVE